MSTIKNRVKSLEEKFKVKGKDGIAEWAMQVARDKSNRLRIDPEPVRRALAEIRGEVYKPKPSKCPELNTEEDILNYAREISEKYSSLEEYQASLPPIDTTPIKKALAAINAIK